MNVQFDRKERLMQILEQDDFDKDQLVAAILAAFGHSTVKTLSVVLADIRYDSFAKELHLSYLFKV